MDPVVLTSLIAHYQYAFIFVTAPFVGPIVTILSGALLKVGSLELLPTLVVIMASELSADVMWYMLGARYGERFGLRFGGYFGITHERIQRVRRAYHRYHDSIILVSKLTAGFGIAPAIFFTAGLSHVPFRRYMLMNMIGQVIWTPAMLAIGYYLGHAYTQIHDALGRVTFIGVALVICLALFLLGRRLSEKFLGTRY